MDGYFEFCELQAYGKYISSGIHPLLSKMRAPSGLYSGMAYRFTDISVLFEISVIGIGKSQNR